VKISITEFVIIVETPNEFTKAIDCLKKEFEMKDLGSTQVLFKITN